MDCGHQWQNHSQPQRLRRNLWHRYVWERQKATDLARKFNHHLDWVREQLAKVTVKPKLLKPQAAVFVADASFFDRLNGVCVFRLPHQQLNVYWHQIATETVAVYQRGREILESQGFRFLAIVLDGRPGVRSVFSDIPVQMCHFHQQAIVTKYLTVRPKLLAGRSLRQLAQTLCQTTEGVFTKELESWLIENESFLKERTTDPLTGRWQYTHRRLRSAYRSLKTNLPYLFTYQKYPQLKIPNTTNSLEGCFSNLKDLVGVHRGITPKLRTQMITEILNKTDP